MQSFRVLLIDDHPVVLLGLRLALEADARFVVCGEATTAQAAREAMATTAPDLAPDLAIADLMLGGEDGAAMIEDLLAIRPDVQVLVYSSCDERLHASQVFRAGARGYVSKAEGLDVVVAALGAIVDGETYLGAAVRQAMIDDLARPDDRTPRTELSTRERQVLRLIAEGYELRAIAARLGLSPKTVGTYRERLKVKLGLDSARALERAAPLVAQSGLAES